MKIYRQKRGVTLIEIGITLILFGLSILVVVAARELIHAVELRSVIKQTHEYDTAVSLFYDKYHAYPGDFNKAVANGLGKKNGKGRDGDGNGFIGSGSTSHPESIAFWYHLMKAKMIKGDFDGTTTKFGKGAPETKLRNVGIWAIGFVVGDNYGRNSYWVGWDDDGSGPVFKVYETYLIDQKVDDGLPFSGYVWTHNNAYACADTGVSPPVYLLDDYERECYLFMDIHPGLLGR